MGDDYNDSDQAVERQTERSQTAGIQVSDEQLRRVLASERSYVGASVIVFLLYWLLWIPGLLANMLYLSEAERMKKLTGRRPAGMGCLYLMFFVGMAPLLLFIWGWIVGSATAASHRYGGSITATPSPTPWVLVATPRPTPRPAPTLTPLPIRTSPPKATPRPLRTPPLSYTPRPTVAAPEVVTSENDFREGVAFQLKSDQEIMLPTGNIRVPRGAWIRIDSVRSGGYGWVMTVEARHADGRFIGTGVMHYQR